jgi:L-ribulose-5-phosphate 3-epimerase
MQILRDLEIGLMFWASGEPSEILRQVKTYGIRCGQLGVPGLLDLDSATTDAWKRALADEEFLLVTVFAAYPGESYADIPTVRRTAGFVPRAARAQREERTYEVADFAAALGVSSIACHAGCLPADRGDPDYIAVRDLVRRVCDYCAQLNQTFALETGQEPAGVLLRFMEDVDRPNLRVNFDPANMILYGSGDPIEALDALGPLVVSVHAKDADRPAADSPGALGTEKPLGEGAVGIERLLAELHRIDYAGTLNIEREIEDEERRAADIRDAVALLERLRAGLMP